MAEATRQKIEELFPQGSIRPDTRLVLANALHLQADWKFPFPPARTSNQPFLLADGTRVDVPTMHYDESLPSGRGLRRRDGRQPGRRSPWTGRSCS